MKVNLSKIKQETVQLKKQKEAYETLYLNYYNDIKDIDEQWNNIYEKRMMQHVIEEKKDMLKVYQQITEIESIYNFIYESYSIFGKNIRINTNDEDVVKNKLNKCINSLEKATYLCNNIDTKNNSNRIKQLNMINNKLNHSLNKLLTVRDNVFKTFDQVNQIESDIRKRISKTDFEIINETDISDSIEK